LILGLIAFLFRQIPEEIISEKIVPEGAAEWETYRNEEYGFEIKYPKNWYNYEWEEGLIAISTFSREEYDKYYATTEIKKLGESYGLIYITFPEKPLEEFFELTKSGIESLKKPGSGYRIEKFVTEDVIIEEMKGYRIYYSGKSFMRFEEGEESINIVYLFLVKEKEEIIRFEGNFKGKNGEKYARDFDQMLSTFKFLE